MKKYDVVTVLDTCVDLILTADDVTPEFGQKEKWIDDYDIELGGSSCIFASQAAKLGLKVSGSGAVGGDFFGRYVETRLKEIGVKTAYLRRESGVKTGLGVLLCKREGDRAILTYGGTIGLALPDDLPDELLAETRHLHIGSYYLLTGLRPHWPEIARTAKAYGATVSLDTNWDPEERWDDSIDRLLPYVDIFLPNREEALRLARARTLEEAAGYFTGKVPAMVVKDGDKGAVSFINGKKYTASPPHVECVDAIGAGDSFDGGYIWAFLRGYDPETCLKAGCFCGSMNVTARGGVAGQAKQEALIGYMDWNGTDGLIPEI